MNDKLIKSVQDKNYLVELYETPDAEFVVQYRVEGGLSRRTAPTFDLKTALIAFDQTLQELEGH